ncbi:TonB-dependent receptor [Pedobacter psychroterrae]|uniref:SusC/RagA family TonB-linked outer membrane protein n=1 Tax=Pedobacter psychroterrae TaxID=2530453 RepID=A0A4R0NPC9_9SPHI|nr:TonB-dependent receptor [Pedobacter psychroterrae]TCD02850.1 SusC/RagA family TonB-linked outer membrane protein [Pedobacter psychroterrae]
MKFTTLLLITVSLQVTASSYAQKITLLEKNAPIKRIFEQIRTQSGYDFLFTTSMIRSSVPVTINVQEAELDKVLEMIFEGQPLEYAIEKKSVVVSRKEASVLDRISSFFAAIEINGRVLDENGSPVNSANIKIKGTDQGVKSGADGRFTITVPNDRTVLVISYIGYLSKEVIAKENIIVNMEAEINQLNDMVVVGYGTVKRKDLTGSVASVNVEEIKDVPFATIDQALNGKAAGVQVVQADGSPGGVAKIRIRGGTSLLGGNDPLYIIDGVQVQVQNRYLKSAAEIISPVESYGGDNASQTISGSFARGLNSLGGFNINDIETIDILKDASATAIYGSRAANGVVIITTKKGIHNQKPVFEANYYTGVSNPIKEKLLDRDQYAMIMKEAAKNLNDARATATPALAPDATATSILTNPDFLGTGNTDWLDLVLRNGITQNADIAVRGGGTGSRYYTSLAFNKNNGTVAGTDYSRIAGKVSLDNEINSRLRINTNLDYGFSTNNITNGMYSQALFAPPTLDAYNPDGSVKIISPAANGTYGFEGFQNPLLLLKGINKSNNVNLLGSLAGEYDVLKSLKFRSTVSVNFNNYRQTNYVPSTAQIAVSGYPGGSKNGVGTQAQSQNVDVFYENTLTWDKQFNDNNRINVLTGTSWQITKSNSFSASGQGFPDDNYLNNLSSAALTLPSTGISGQNSLLSFYMRANYALYEKYLFTFTGRSDASSKFPESNRVGYFPSGGVAWRISEENFLKGVKWIDEIKLRASAGYTGTQNIADNLFYTLYSPVSYAGLNGLSPSQLGNDKIKWESTLQKDAGIDFAFFKSRLSGGIGYYEKATKGVLFQATVARSSGFNGVTANIADIRNRGLELSLRGDFLRVKNLHWSGSLNISGNRSKVLALSNDFSDPSNPKIYRYGNNVLKVGEPLGLMFGYQYDGLLRTQEEVDDYASKNLYAQFGFFPYLGIGDSRYVLDEATKFNKSDIIGRAEPKYYGGYTNTLIYKNLSLITLATFSYGGDIFYLADIQNADAGARTNKGVRILDRWTPENPNTDRPRLILGQGNSPQNGASNNVYDASFLKLKSVTLNYQFSPTLMNKLKMQTASVYVSATNLFTITNYPGADPEVSNDPYSVIGGYSDSGGYPTVRQLSFGLRFGF